MQSDGSLARTADLLSKCHRLEKENTDLAHKCSVLDQTELELNSMGTQVILLEAEKVEMNAKIEDLEREMRRRETGMSEIVFMSGVCVYVFYFRPCIYFSVSISPSVCVYLFICISSCLCVCVS